jgi:hypothetical protein
MNAVEIEEAVSKLAEQPFDADSFPFDFLAAFGNKETTLKRPPTCAPPTSATTRRWSASTSAAVSRTTPSASKRSSPFTPR